MAFGIRFCLVTLTGIIVMEVPNFNSLMSLIGNLLKSIDNCSGAALKTDRILWTTSCTHKFSLFQLIKLFLTILVIYGFHSENLEFRTIFFPSKKVCCRECYIGHPVRLWPANFKCLDVRTLFFFLSGLRTYRSGFT